MFRWILDSESLEDRGCTKNDQNMMGEDDRPLVEKKKDHFHFLFTKQKTWSRMLNFALSGILLVFPWIFFSFRAVPVRHCKSYQWEMRRSCGKKKSWVVVEKTFEFRLIFGDGFSPLCLWSPPLPARPLKWRFLVEDIHTWQAMM